MMTLAVLRRRSPWGLVGMVFLATLIELFIGSRAMILHDTDEWAFRWTWKAATRKARTAQILCFGDSLVKLGVIPSILKERTGKPAFNLAVSGSQAPTSYFLLKRALDSGAKPEAVVVDFTPPLLRIGPRHILTRWSVMLRPDQTARLAWWARDPLLFGEVTVGQVIPSLRSKAIIRANLREALEGRNPVQIRWNGMALRNWQVNQGSQLMLGSTAVTNLSDLDVEKLREGYYPEWSCHPANLEGVDQFLGLAARHGITVFWVLPPLLPALHDKLASSGIDAQHEAFIRSRQARFPNVVVLDGRRKIDELNAFWDPQHLSVDGASAFSRALGDTIRRTLKEPSSTGEGGPRWVAVPRFQLGPLAPGIENMDQSGLAVMNASTVRR